MHYLQAYVKKKNLKKKEYSLIDRMMELIFLGVQGNYTFGRN